MTVDLTLFSIALLLGLVAAILGRPRPPALDAGRLWAVCRSALTWGQHEHDQDPVAAWTDQVKATLLYHPTARLGWAKLANPEAIELPVPSLPGERALVDELAKLEPGRPRFDRLFADDAAFSALLDDPRALGDEYEPGRWLGHGCDWEALARWDESVRAAIGRKLEHHHLVVMAAPDQADAAAVLAGALEGQASVHALSLDGCDPDDEPAQALAESLRALAPKAADRLVPVVLGDAGPLLLAALLGDPELRDRVVALVLDGCPLMGVPEASPPGLSIQEREAWLVEHFDQDSMDTELRRCTPYCTIARLRPEASPPGDGRVPWAFQRLDEPPVPPSGRRPVAVMDLGVAPADRTLLAPLVQARSLLLLLAFLLGEGAPRP